jgi:hypothetical protein
VGATDVELAWAAGIVDAKPSARFRQSEVE